MDRKCDRFALMVAPWLLAASVPAVAGTVYQWNGGNCLTGASLVSTCTDTSTVPAGGPTLTYSAISDTGATTNGQRGLASAYVGNYNPNLGITSRSGPNSSPANTQETTAAPDHAIDNNGNSEFMELSFASAVNLTQVQLGYYSGDSDITVLAYTGSGTPTFSGQDLQQYRRVDRASAERMGARRELLQCLHFRQRNLHHGRSRKGHHFDDLRLQLLAHRRV